MKEVIAEEEEAEGEQECEEEEESPSQMRKSPAKRPQTKIKQFFDY